MPIFFIKLVKNLNMQWVKLEMNANSQRPPSQQSAKTLRDFFEISEKCKQLRKLHQTQRLTLGSQITETEQFSAKEFQQYIVGKDVLGDLNLRSPGLVSKLREHLTSYSIGEKSLTKLLDFVLKRLLFAPRNESWEAKYRPLLKEHIFQDDEYSNIESKILSLLHIKKGSGMARRGVIINGPGGCGKTSLLEAYCTSNGFQVKKIDFTAFKKIKDIIVTLREAANAVDIRLDIEQQQQQTMSAFSRPAWISKAPEPLFKAIEDRHSANHLENEAKRQASFSRPDKTIHQEANQMETNPFLLPLKSKSFLPKFAIQNSVSHAIVDSKKISSFFGKQEMDSQIRRKKKLFIFTNTEHLFYDQYLPHKNIFEQTFNELLTFCEQANLACVFIHPRKYNAVFGSLNKNFEKITFGASYHRQLELLIYIVAFTELNFGPLVQRGILRFINKQQMDSSLTYEGIYKHNCFMAEEQISRAWRKDNGLNGLIWPSLSLVKGVISSLGFNYKSSLSKLQMFLTDLSMRGPSGLDGGLLGLQADSWAVKNLAYNITNSKNAVHTKEANFIEKILIHKMSPFDLQCFSDIEFLDVADDADLTDLDGLLDLQIQIDTLDAYQKLGKRIPLGELEYTRSLFHGCGDFVCSNFSQKISFLNRIK